MHNAKTQVILAHTTDMGQLHSITDVAAQHTLGTQYVDSTGAVFEYWYNGAGAAAVQNNLYWRVNGAAGLNPQSLAIADGQAYVQFVGVAQAAIPSTYYGWYQIEGPTASAVYFDCIDQNGTDTTTDGEALEISSGVIVDDTALDHADLKHFATAIEAVTTATGCKMYLFGRHTLSTA